MKSMFFQRIKRILLIAIFLCIGTSSIDYRLPAVGAEGNHYEAAFNAPMEPEEMDCPEGPLRARRMPPLIANTISLVDGNSLCSVSTSVLPPILSHGQCPVQALLVSWLDKQETFQTLKTEPLWLQYGVLLI